VEGFNSGVKGLKPKWMGQKKLPGEFYFHNYASVLRRELRSSGLLYSEKWWILDP
jgi:hypothetical protein